MQYFTSHLKFQTSLAVFTSSLNLAPTIWWIACAELKGDCWHLTLPWWSHYFIAQEFPFCHPNNAQFITSPSLDAKKKTWKQHTVQVHTVQILWWKHGQGKDVWKLFVSSAHVWETSHGKHPFKASYGVILANSVEFLLRAFFHHMHKYFLESCTQYQPQFNTIASLIEPKDDIQSNMLWWYY